MKMMHQYKKGQIDGWMISTIGLVVLVLGAGSLAIWALLNWQEQKTNVDSKIGEASAIAKNKQAEEDEKKFAEREKEPRREFVGPADYGRLSFTYPKTWSVYVDKDLTADSSSKDYLAFLHPVVVPPVDARDQQFAIRVSILSEGYDSYLKKYDRQLKDGKLRSSTVSINGENVIRLDGNFSDKIRGAAIVFRIRDKTAIIQTDADTFKPDFDALIKTVTYVK